MDKKKLVRKPRLVEISKAKSAYVQTLKSNPGHIARSQEQLARAMITGGTPNWGGLRITYKGVRHGGN